MILDGFGRQPIHTVDELLELPGRDLVHVQVPNALIDAWGHLPVVGLRFLAQGLFHILREPLVGESLKLDVAIGEGRAAALLVKEDHLSGKLLLNLPLRHSWCGRPGPALHHLLALRGIAHRGTNPVGIAAFCIGCHNCSFHV